MPPAGRVRELDVCGDRLGPLIMNEHMLAIFGLPGGAEWIAIGLVALLIFGRRLPDVARSVGRSIVEFKKGLRDVKENVKDASRLEAKDDNLEMPNPLTGVKDASRLETNDDAKSESKSDEGS